MVKKYTYIEEVIQRTLFLLSPWTKSQTLGNIAQVSEKMGNLLAHWINGHNKIYILQYIKNQGLENK